MNTAKLAIVDGPPHPTGPDVDRLAAELDYTEGTVHAHETLEAMICATRKDNRSRYQTVVDAWKRRMLRDRSIDLRSVPGVGYKVLNSGERLEHGCDMRHTSVRWARRSVRVQHTVDRAKLNEHERALHDHEMKIGGALIAIGRQAMKQVGSAEKAKALGA